MATTAFCVSKPGSIIWNGKFIYDKNNNDLQRDIALPDETNADQIKNINVSTKDIDVVVKEGDTFKIESNDPTLKPASFDKEQGALSLESPGSGNLNPKISILGVYSNARQVVITIPRELSNRNLSVSTHSGDILVWDSTFDTVNAHTDNGDIMFRGNKVKNVNFSNHNGDIMVGSDITDGGKITNKNGDIHMSNSSLPEYSVKTTNGSFMTGGLDKKKNPDSDQATLLIDNKNDNKNGDVTRAS